MRISIDGGEWKGARLGVATGSIDPATVDRILYRVGRIVDRLAAALEAAAAIAAAEKTRPVVEFGQAPDDDGTARVNH